MIKSPSTLVRPSTQRIRLERFVRFIKVGAFLHIMAVFAVFVCVTTLRISLYYFEDERLVGAYLFLFLAIWSFTIPFFAEFDAMGRYQNYKQVKDTLFKLGYDQRLLRPFMHSKCQRDAVVVAAHDLGYGSEVKEFFYETGYRWYHILPDAFMRNPLVLFSGMFWQRILFTKRYELQNFFW